MMKVRATDGSNGTTEYHNCECSHDKGGFGYTYEIEVEASSIKELCRKLELEVNKDFAADQGMSVEQFMAEGLGYVVSTNKGYAFRVFPCVKF